MKRRDQAAFLNRLWRLEDSLVAAGFPAMPEWWRKTISRFYLSGKRRLVVRKGRRVFASTCVAPRLAVAEMLFGGHPHLRGTPPNMFVFLSVKRDEAAKRLRGITAILDVLGEKYTERGETIELESTPAMFAVMTANFRTSVGDTVAFAWCDEVSRWLDVESSANPAAQVIGSLSPALATLPDAPMFLVSSPLGIDDYHAKAYEMGETAGQCIAFGETWTINPTLTREMCEQLEPDPKTFAREYGAQPQGTVTSAFDPDHVAAAFGKPWPELFRTAPIIATDASGGRGDAFTWCAMGWHAKAFGEPIDGTVPLLDTCGNDVAGIYQLGADGNVKRTEHGQPLIVPGAERLLRPQLCISRMRVVEGEFYGNVGLDEIAGRIGQLYHASNAKTVVGDGYAAVGLESEIRRTGARFHPIAVSQTSKGQAVIRLRRLFADGQVTFYEDDPKLRAELLAFKEIVRASGSLSFSGKGGGRRDDRVGAIINGIIAELAGLMPGSPMRQTTERGYAPLDNRI